MNRISIATVFLGVALMVSGCKTTGSAVLTEADQAADAEKNLREGEAELKDHNFPEAERLFQYVRSKYPFFEAARTAELRLADTEFEREKWAEARDRYQAFVRIHPTHPQVDYAAFRAALTYVKDYPSNFFLLPPAEEKDQTAARSALRAMGDFVRQFPSSPLMPEAKTHQEQARLRLAQHELYVASFYRRRDRWAAVAGRLEALLQNYPGTKYDAEALFGLHEAYLAMKKPEQAQEALRRLIERLPNTPEAARAQRLLGSS